MHTKKIFVLKKCNSPYIEQAIFILREEAKDGSVPPKDAILEAERIVRDYLGNKENPRPKRRIKWAFLVGGITILYFLTRFLL